MADDAPRLFDTAGLQAEEMEIVELTLSDSPLARPARIGFLAGMLALWIFDGKPSEAQKEALKAIARDTLERATAVHSGGEHGTR